MDGPTVTIGALELELRTLGTPPERRETQARQLCDNLIVDLPALLESALARRHGVIRINALRVDLADPEGRDPGQLAWTLGRLIAGELTRSLEDRSGLVQFWADRPWYLASYVLHRLGDGDTPAWCFDEFTALCELSGSQSLITLAGVEPRLLTVLARTGHARLLVDSLGGEGCRQLLAVLLARTDTHHRPLARWPDIVPARGTADPGRLAAATVQLLLSACSTPGTDPDGSPAGLLLTAMAVAGLAALEPDSVRRWDGQDLNAMSDADRCAVAAPLPAAYRAALGELMQDASGQVLLAGQLRRMLGGTAPPRATHAPQATGPRPAGAVDPGDDPAPLELASARAGCALLLPTALRLGLHHVLSPRQMLGCLAAALGPEQEDDAVRDPLLQALCAARHDAPLPDWPVTPQSLAARIDERAQGLLREPGAGGWAGLLLAGFAATLPGLRHSSAAYLRRQFLLVPGSLRLDDVTAAVRIQGPDLAVVLAMAGLNAAQGPLPWLGGRVLYLELTGLRP